MGLNRKGVIEKRTEELHGYRNQAFELIARAFEKTDPTLFTANRIIVEKSDSTLQDLEKLVEAQSISLGAISQVVKGVESIHQLTEEDPAILALRN